VVTLIEQLESEANAQSRYREESGQPPSFFQNLFQAMKDGTSMLMAWVQLAPQIPIKNTRSAGELYARGGGTRGSEWARLTVAPPDANRTSVRLYPVSFFTVIRNEEQSAHQRPRAPSHVHRNKQGLVDGERARIGWVELSKTWRIREGNLEKGREMLDSAKLVVMADAAR
jgi:hypothetical protein